MTRVNILERASKQTDTHQFDLVLDALETVPEEYRRFMCAKHIMDYIRATGEIPPFVIQHCTRVILEERQPALL